MLVAVQINTAIVQISLEISQLGKKKLKIEVLCHTVYPENSIFHKIDICTPLSTALLLIISKDCKLAVYQQMNR